MAKEWFVRVETKRLPYKIFVRLKLFFATGFDQTMLKIFGHFSLRLRI